MKYNFERMLSSKITNEPYRTGPITNVNQRTKQRLFGDVFQSFAYSLVGPMFLFTVKQTTSNEQHLHRVSEHTRAITNKKGDRVRLSLNVDVCFFFFCKGVERIVEMGCSRLFVSISVIRPHSCLFLVVRMTIDLETPSLTASLSARFPQELECFRT